MIGESYWQPGYVGNDWRLLTLQQRSKPPYLDELKLAELGLLRLRVLGWGGHRARHGGAARDGRAHAAAALGGGRRLEADEACKEGRK